MYTDFVSVRVIIIFFLAHMEPKTHISTFIYLDFSLILFFITDVMARWICRCLECKLILKTDKLNDLCL